MSTIRKMGDQDADAVREIEPIAFGARVKQVRGEAAALDRRTQTNILVCRQKDPEGCFVAEKDGRMVLGGTDEGPSVDRCVGLARWAG